MRPIASRSAAVALRTRSADETVCIRDLRVRDWGKPCEERRRGEGAEKLYDDEGGRVLRPDSGERVGERSRDRDGGGCERRRRPEPGWGHGGRPARVPRRLANDVDGVNQYAATMYAATAYGVAAGRERTQPEIAASSPNVATNSLTSIPGPPPACPDAKNRGRPNIPSASAVPHSAPAICATTYHGTADHATPPCQASASVTAGLKCAPDTGPNVRISATSAPPVASAFASSASPTFPPHKRCAMIPEPTTAASRNAVPVNSAATGRRFNARCSRSCRRCRVLRILRARRRFPSGVLRDRSPTLWFARRSSTCRRVRRRLRGPQPAAARSAHRPHPWNPRRCRSAGRGRLARRRRDRAPTPARAAR